MCGTPIWISAGAISVARVMYAGVASSPMPTNRLTTPTRISVGMRCPPPMSMMNRETFSPTPLSSSAPIMMPTAPVMAAMTSQRETASRKARMIFDGVSQSVRLRERKLVATTKPVV